MLQLVQTWRWLSQNPTDAGFLSRECAREPLEMQSDHHRARRWCRVHARIGRRTWHASSGMHARFPPAKETERKHCLLKRELWLTECRPLAHYACEGGGWCVEPRSFLVLPWSAPMHI